MDNINLVNDVQTSIIDLNTDISTDVNVEEMELGAKNNETRPILLWLRKSSLSVMKKVNKKQLELFFIDPNIQQSSEQNNVENEKNKINLQQINISKKFILSSKHTDILTHDAITFQKVKNFAVPPFYKRGLFLIPLREAFNVQEMLNERMSEREQLVNDFILNYDDIIKGMIPILGPVFNYNDYPSVEAVRSKYSFTYKFLSFDTPLSLKIVSLALYENEKLKSEEYFSNIREQVKNALTLSYKKLVDHLIDKLSAKKNGLPGRFTDRTVNDVTEFIDKFTSKNSIANDEELNKLVNDAKSIMQGFNVDVIRKDKDLQNTIIEGFTKIQQNLNDKIKLSDNRNYFNLEEEDTLSD